MPDTGKMVSPDSPNLPVSEPQAMTGSMSHNKELKSRRGYCWLSVLNPRGLGDGDFGMSAHTCPEVQHNVADEAGKDPTSERDVHLFHNCLLHTDMYAVFFRMLQRKVSFTMWDILLVVSDTHTVSAFEAFGNGGGEGKECLT